MPSQNGLRLNHLGRAKKARPELRHPYEQAPVAAAKAKTRRRPPQCDIQLKTEKQVLGSASSRIRDLNAAATNIPNICRTASIVLNDATILPYGANPFRMEFSERTAFDAAYWVIIRTLIGVQVASNKFWVSDKQWAVMTNWLISCIQVYQ